MSAQGSGQRGPLDLIIVEDSAVDVELIADALREAGVAADMRRVDDEAAFFAALDERLPDAILADWTLPDFSGRRALEIAHERCPETPFIFVSGTISETSAIEALHKGAVDYVYKHQLILLAPVLIRAIDEARAQIALRKSEEKYRQLFESSRDALLVIMPPAGRLISVNQAARNLFGLASSADITLLVAADLSAERQPDGCPSDEKAQEMIARTLREGSQLLEWMCRRSNGETFIAEVLATRIDVGQQELLQLTVRDITERKQAEFQLQEQLNELRRWQDATLGRELRTLELKREVNELLGKAGLPPRYLSMEKDAE